MSDEQDRLVEAIQSSGFTAAMVTTGGGSGLIHALLSHPGASRFIHEAQVPYSPGALAAYLGKEPQQSCSKDTAKDLARIALRHVPKAKELALGIACTAALQTRRKRRGKDRAYICIQSRSEQMFEEVEFGPGSRREQEELLSEVILEMIADFVGVGQ